MKLAGLSAVIVVTMMGGASAQDILPACSAQPDTEAAAFIDCARAVSERYRDRANATLDGYRPIGRDFPAMGEHWINVSLVFDGRFEAAHPEVLTYAVIDGMPRLLGVAYAIPLLSGESVPQFPAGAQVWHDHTRTIEDETVLPLPRGHSHSVQSARVAMMHVWTDVDNPDGIFAPENWAIPCIRVGRDCGPNTPRAAAKALSLVAGGVDYVEAVVAAAAKMAPAERRAMTAIIKTSKAAVSSLLASHSRPTLTSSEVEALIAIWNRMWSQLDRAVNPQAARRLTEVSIR